MSTTTTATATTVPVLDSIDNDEIDIDPVIHFYTDGACSGNPGPGGWGVVGIRGNDNGGYTNGTKAHRAKNDIELSGHEAATTNNRMELLATIKALESLSTTAGASEIHITTDSRYVKDGITQWILRWRKNGWQTSNKKPIKNKDLWLRLDALQQRYGGRGGKGAHSSTIEWHWVKGHAGHPGNTRADKLATEAIRHDKGG